MITKEQAIALASSFVNEQYSEDDKLVIPHESIIEKDYGWVMFYNTESYLGTGEARHALAGNGPLIVDRVSGVVTALGTGKSVEEIIRDYENSRDFDS